MDIQKQIKEKLLFQIYGDIDKIYDFMEQHYNLTKENEDLLIKKLNQLKDQLYLINSQSDLS